MSTTAQRNTEQHTGGELMGRADYIQYGPHRVALSKAAFLDTLFTGEGTPLGHVERVTSNGVWLYLMGNRESKRYVVTRRGVLAHVTRDAKGRNVYGYVLDHWRGDTFGAQSDFCRDVLEHYGVERLPE